EERLSPEYIRNGVASGTIVIPSNSKNHPTKYIGIGKGLRTKVNANIGTSPDVVDIEGEIRKAHIAENYGADTIMDLSTGGNLSHIRRKIKEAFSGPLGTVPIYEIACRKAEMQIDFRKAGEDEIIDIVEEHARDGVDFVTVHCGVTKCVIDTLKSQGRIMDIVSRGGAILAAWMEYNKKENPLYLHFDKVLDIAREYDLTLSLGDGLRPGSIIDSTDRPQIEELIVLGELRDRALEAGVQVMIEGPGHIPIHEVKMNVEIEKSICKGAPFYVLGPIVTDIAPGYDHITSAIGGALAAAYGADFLCYVTPAEHIGLPTEDDVKEGVIATRIAAHAGDIAKGLSGALDIDKEISTARRRLDWKKQRKLAINPGKIAAEKGVGTCTMCGNYCAIKIIEEYVTSETGKKQKPQR
ncbi:MAG: phosphomethylpyrimidine synthase ThiC, partial [candidate division WOR-3 bacterium]|nr:phosphomethylpyrimidine synthase ThiC [candidate division WOR-3 bacterium]